MIEAFQGEREIVLVMEHLAGVWAIRLYENDHDNGDDNQGEGGDDHDNGGDYHDDDLHDRHSGGELFDLVADEEFQLTEGQVGDGDDGDGDGDGDSDGDAEFLLVFYQYFCSEF